MSNFYNLYLIIIFIYSINTSTIILPFSYKNKKEQIFNSNSKESYFESRIDNTIYTPIKIYNQTIDFHVSMERYPIYISDTIYKKFNDLKKIDNKKDILKLYSLNQIGINRAALINKTIFIKTNISSENKIEEINLFRARKFINTTEEEKKRLNYASEEAEIGFNIVRGSQFEYVEETENDLDTEALQEEYEREKMIQKAYEEFYNRGNIKEEKGINVSSYNPLNEYEFNPYEVNEDGKIKRIYDEDIYNIYDDKDNNITKKIINRKNENNNKKNDEEKKDENIKFVGDGLFKEESANFISQMKKKKKINSYSFSIKYNPNNEESGEIIIGDLPHEYAPEIYSFQNYFFDHVSITKEPPFNWHFKYKKLLYDNSQIDSGNSVKFSIDFGFIQGNNNLKIFLDNNFFNGNNCFKSEIKNYFIYYCKEDAIKNFKSIIFELESKYCPTNMRAKFEFTYKDLFIKGDNNFYYFQIIFPSSFKNNFVFGKPLFKKYQMVFDQDRKTYGFYLKLNQKKNENLNNSLKISWTLVVILVIISLILVYFLKRLLSKLPRRLKANELEDNFTYESPVSKYNSIEDKKIELEQKNKLYENF